MDIFSKRIEHARSNGFDEKDDAIVLDTRPAKEFKAGHILGARQIKPEELREKNFKKLENSKDKPIIVV
ncbi:rhodanese domain protein, partial [marine sediment metagenome]